MALTVPRTSLAATPFCLSCPRTSARISEPRPWTASVRAVTRMDWSLKRAAGSEAARDSRR
eukprot:2754005-Prymnesium_polylepis.1